ncbi:MAG: hypothetical protein FD124_1635 [Alphaproteobacteria bacterium]|nr:MAG: hypothetical protein FD160_1522 [Caulobacteraceae bacterium]TPW06635.1 MAG: hypothetical protein FD124_1635 [Alphaproteobacteria bacterium]
MTAASTVSALRAALSGPHHEMPGAIDGQGPFETVVKGGARADAVRRNGIIADGAEDFRPAHARWLLETAREV